MSLYGFLGTDHAREEREPREGESRTIKTQHELLVFGGVPYVFEAMDTGKDVVVGV
jgi:hypothetical protein